LFILIPTQNVDGNARSRSRELRRRYQDVIDALEREASKRHEGISREESLAIVSEVMAHTPGFASEEGEFDSLPGNQFGLLQSQAARNARSTPAWHPC
jgi:hypothetical protein